MRQLLVWHSESLVALNPLTGEQLWSVPLKPLFGMAIAAPRKAGSYLLASNYGVAALLKLDDQQPGAEIVWRGEPENAIYAANVTPLLDSGVAYGCDIETGALMGVQLSDATRLWQTTVPTFGGPRRARYGTAFVVKHQDRYVLMSEQGDVIFAQLTPQGYQEQGRFHLLEPTESIFGRQVVWSHPAFANRCLYARNDKQLVCVDLADQAN